MLWNAKNGQVPLGNTEMSWVSFGRGNKPVIILPGLSDGLATVKGKALLLAKPYSRFLDRYTVYLFSRKNDLPAGCSIRDMADDQAEALRALDLEKVSVLGVSQGGMIAQLLAAGHPELVEKLVIAVSAPRANELVRACIGRWIDYARQGDHKGLMIDTAENMYSEAFLKKYRKLYPVIGAVGKPRDYGRFLTNAEAILHFDALPDLDRITCPTLILGGGKDRVAGVQASHELKERIAGSELYVYPELGHAAYEEADDFNDRVFRFLDAAP